MKQKKVINIRVLISMSIENIAEDYAKNTDVVRIVERLKRVFNFDKDIELANYLEIQKATLSNWQRRNTIDFSLIMSKCVNLKINLDWLFTGRGSMYREATGNVSQSGTGNTSVNGNGAQVNIKGAVQGGAVASVQQESTAEVARLQEALKVCGAEKEALHERLKEAQEAVKNAMEAVKMLATGNKQ